MGDLDTFVSFLTIVLRPIDSLAWMAKLFFAPLTLICAVRD